MQVLAALAGFFTALPDIIKAIQAFMAWINKVSGNDPQGYLKKVTAAMSQLNNAQTVEERQNAAKSIADLFAGM